MRKLIKSKAAWVSETALLKQLYLSIKQNEKSWKSKGPRVGKYSKADHRIIPRKDTHKQLNHKPLGSSAYGLLSQRLVK